VDAVADSNDQAEPLTLGQTLARERERQGLSRADIAQRLHMSPSQIEALEAGDYPRLPKGTFLRGFVRNYAKLLALPAESVLSMLKEGRPHDPLPGIVVPTQNIRFDPLGDRLSSPYVKAAVYAVVAVTLAFAVMYWWLFVKPTPPGAAAAPRKSTVVEVVPQNVASAPLPPVPEPAPPKDLTMPAPVEAKAADAPKAEVPRADAPRGGERTLTFRFKGPSWVEVRDSRGRALFQQLNPAGSEAQVVARPPFSVVVGNAPDVQMRMNDQAFNLDPHTRVAVARFTVE
jgi:cytoskeleton protein RodZ